MRWKWFWFACVWKFGVLGRIYNGMRLEREKNLGLFPFCKIRVCNIFHLIYIRDFLGSKQCILSSHAFLSLYCCYCLFVWLLFSHFFFFGYIAVSDFQSSLFENLYLFVDLKEK